MNARLNDSHARLLRSTLALALLICFSGIKAAQALPITYTFSGVGNGRLGTSTFSGSSFVISCAADTSQIVDARGSFVAPVSVATIFVQGLGIATFTTPTMVTLNPFGSFVTFATSAYFPMNYVPIFSEFNNAALASYNLAAAIGPISGPASGTSNPNLNNPIVTSAGNLSLQTISAASFQASVPDQSSTLILLGVGLVAIRFTLGTIKNPI